MRIALLVVFGWALVATVLAIGPERIVGWLGAPGGDEPPAPPEAPAVAVYGTPVEGASLPGWSADDVFEALPALLRSCDRVLAQPADRPLNPVDLGGTPGDWRPFCGALRGLGDEAGQEEVRAVIERETGRGAACSARRGGRPAAGRAKARAGRAGSASSQATSSLCFMAAAAGASGTACRCTRSRQTLSWWTSADSATICGAAA